MRKLFLNVIAIAAVGLLASSCLTISEAGKESVELPPLKVTRADYVLTDDLSAEAEVRVYLGFIMRGADKKNIKTGKIYSAGQAYGAGLDEKLAIYNLIEQNPDVDYLTNIRYYKTYTQKPFVKKFKTKVVAKGIVLKTDK